MSEEQKEKVYPVKSLHDFLFELDEEWSKFRNGSLVALISSGIMFALVLWLLLVFRRLARPTFFEFFFLLAAAVLLAYSIYAMYSQYRFFNKWERRIGLLLHMEEELIAGKLDDKTDA